MPDSERKKEFVPNALEKLLQKSSASPGLICHTQDAAHGLQRLEESHGHNRLQQPAGAVSAPGWLLLTAM